MVRVALPLVMQDGLHTIAKAQSCSWQEAKFCFAIQPYNQTLHRPTPTTPNVAPPILLACCPTVTRTVWQALPNA